ncbi:MAG: hypothetical protein DCC52_09940 [Chloroflexi bacterium]|nr:MAG: hypothetical protein DCC52_09940 [Chloroflexota bacterium]
MGDLRQTVTGLANAIPGYTGYKSKEQRRDADRILRERLTQQYNAPRPPVMPVGSTRRRSKKRIWI